MDYLFKKVRAITMDEGAPQLENAFVGVSGGDIVYISSEEPKERALKTINCEGKLMLPGFINAHCHIAAVSMRGYADDMALHPWLYEKIFPAEARLDRRAVRASSLLGMAELIRNGVTTSADMYFHIAETAAAALECGLNLNTCNALVEFDDENADFAKDRSYTDSLEVLRDYHMAAGGQIRLDASIHAEYTSGPRGWAFEVEFAQKHGFGMQLHLSETEREQRECLERRGKTPAAALDEYGVFDLRCAAAHCVWLSEQDRALLAEKGVAAVYNPVSNLKLASGIADISALKRAGVRVALGTDGASSNNSYDLISEMKTGALLQKALSGSPETLPAREALKMATVEGAYALGREKERGSIKTGLRADLILLDMNSPSLAPCYDPCSAAVYSARGADVCFTMANGKVLYDGELRTIDLERVIYEVNSYVKPLVEGR
ncbi:MAG: amidohydrolase [Oscillospiraceae bacterium]|nr:amidohydrolase [Oscillospiraceae bacterium]